MTENQRLNTDLLSEGLIFAYEQAHNRINKKSSNDRGKLHLVNPSSVVITVCLICSLSELCPAGEHLLNLSDPMSALAVDEMF